VADRQGRQEDGGHRDPAPGEDEFAVPNGVDLSQYPIVDISVEQPGDPKHSGNSVLRGTIAS
jgi:hypothetical protein